MCRATDLDTDANLTSLSVVIVEIHNLNTDTNWVSVIVVRVCIDIALLSACSLVPYVVMDRDRSATGSLRV